MQVASACRNNRVSVTGDCRRTTSVGPAICRRHTVAASMHLGGDEEAANESIWNAFTLLYALSLLWDDARSFS
ncbi:hypothetical protein EVAR_96949_1 [Eumeta japonica]|uniref:Uncharacterized protein n=1 Tax=Eumeta variegata TaxID=151549 RepID=A0A4C1VDR5_EUMVA|nr:hypothetical protein EVAR_96949_1 [Eumeta japonica]